jgi:hypothetical protein
VGRDRVDGEARTVKATPEHEPDEDESGSSDTEDEYLDAQEDDSFPASDPHSDWSGPPERD